MKLLILLTKKLGLWSKTLKTMQEGFLKKHLKHLHSLADALLEFETLSGDEVRDLIKGKKKVVKNVDDDFTNNKTSMPKSSKTKISKSKKGIPLNPGIVPGT